MAFSCSFFCCPWYLGQGPRCFSPHARDCTTLPLTTPPPTSLPISSHLESLSTLRHRPAAPRSPENPSVAVALLAVFAFSPIVTEARARRHPVQTITVVLLLTLAPFHQCFPSTNDVGSEHASGRCTFMCGLPNITAFSHFAHIQNGEFKAAQTKLKRRR